MALRSMTAERLIHRIEQREARIAIIGLGYAGLPLAVSFAEAGFPVLGIDIDTERVAQVNAGRSYLSDVPDEQLAPLVAAEGPPGGGRLQATASYDALQQADAILICVPTPLSKTGDPDLSYIVAATEEVAQRLRQGQLVVLESTTYPGTTDEVVLPRLSAKGYQVGQDFYLAFSPERVDPGRKDWTLRNTPKVIGGVTAACVQVAQALYEPIIQQLVYVSSARTAEMVKLLENTFRAVNVGLVNEVAMMCDRLGIDVWEVIEAASTKPFGFMLFYPGPGLGGHCVPVDPQYLAWKLRTLDYNPRFIELAAQINFGMSQYVVEKITDALNQASKPLKGSQILVLGVAYKRDIGDTRESPALDIIRLLQSKGAQVSYHDSYVPQLSADGVEMASVPLETRTLEEADCVVVVTDHSGYDWPWVVEKCRLLVDTRNVTKGIAPKGTRIVRL